MHSNLFTQSAIAAFSLLSFLASGAVLAQADGQKIAPAAANPTVLVYRSELENYQRYSETKVQSWRAANDTVKDIGGWRAYAREFTQEATQAPEMPKSPQDSRHGGRQ